MHVYCIVSTYVDCKPNLRIMESAGAAYQFAAPVLRLETGMKMHYMPLPIDVAADLNEKKIRRVMGTLNGVSVRRAVMGKKSEEQYLVLGRSLLREIGVIVGDTLLAELNVDPDPDFVDVGEEFEAVLADDPEAARRFFGMTPGKQRSLAHYVNSAKRVETRIKRALEVAYKLRTYSLYGDTAPEE